MKMILAAILLCGMQAFAQTLTIPAQTFTQNVTVNGTTVKLTLTVPAQKVTLPASGGSGLPSGMSYANNVLTVQGSISTGTLSLTGGPTLPTCTTNLYLWQFVAGTPGSLQPVCYKLPILSLPPTTP